ncbi:MAG: NAD(P)H-dependent oxidoreductase [Spirochaetia bacterium]|jgi:multimeric flavodoxin WrbA
MKIVVLNGSPKGDVSVTRQYVLYLEKAFPQHQFVVLHVAQQSRKLERDAAAFDAVIREVRSADGVIWAFPLYILLVCSQYKRFIELITERGAQSAFSGKHAVTLSTSINYYDSNAHVYMRSVCEDLGMRFVGIHSANMHDLMKPEERRRLHLFAEDFFTSIERGLEFPRLSAVLPSALPGEPPRPYRPVSPVRPADARGRKIVILTDARTDAGPDARPEARPGQESLQAMTARLVSAWGGDARVVNLHDIDIKGGCQGCLRCGAAYQCAYTGKDGFIDFYNSVLVPADIIVFAGAIVARQLSWKWKEFFDRSFFNTHTPSLVGKQFAFMVAGPLSQLPELRQTYEAWTELQQSNLVTFVSDETAPTVLDAALDQLAERLVRFAEAAYIRPRTFLGVAGMKIFRDDIWSSLKVVFRADHKAYKRLGFYDFPQRRVGRRTLMGLAWFITGLPGIKSKFRSMMRTQMIVPMHRAALAATPGGSSRR